MCHYQEPFSQKLLIRRRREQTRENLKSYQSRYIPISFYDIGYTIFILIYVYIIND